MNKIYLVPLWILFLLSTGGYAQIQHSVSFDRNNLEVTSRQENGTNYTFVNYKDCVSDDQEGYPDLPYRFLRFIVPNDPASFSITINSLSNGLTNLSDRILPIQLPQYDLMYDIANEFKTPNSLIYNSTEKYPKELVKVVDEGYLDGDKRIITLRVAPVQYIGASNQIVFNSFIKFTINFVNQVTSVENQKNIIPVSSVNGLTNDLLMQNLNFVENKSDIIKYAPVRRTNYIVSGNQTLPYFEYVIITSSSLAPYFDKLINWKRMKGINAGVITLQSILNEPSIVKDEISNLDDNAGKIRQYLRLAYQNGTKYVLLRGNADIIPFRYGSGNDNYMSKDSNIPTDLYYSDLNGNWNKDGDEYLGERGEVDYYPELFVGRILCKNPQEVKNYVNKLLIYEKNPGKGNNAYLSKAFIAQSDNAQNKNLANDLNSLLPFSTKTIFEEIPGCYEVNTTSPSACEVINEMNKLYGFVELSGHGDARGISVMTDNKSKGDWNVKVWREGITALDSYEDVYAHKTTGNGIDCLTNYTSPFVVYSTACQVVPYDQIQVLPYNVGEAFTTLGSFGSIAFLGGTRSMLSGPNYAMCKQFISLLDDNDYIIGKAEALSRSKANSHWNTLAHNLIGCPEVRMWTHAPSQFTNVSVFNSANTLNVNTDIGNSEIALKGLFECNSKIQKSIGTSCSFQNVPKNYIVTVSKHNYLPYIAPIYLQNEEVTGKHYIIGDKILLGNNVDQTKQSGNLVIKNKANVTLETSNCVTLEGGFTVEAGATFEIIPNK